LGFDWVKKSLKTLKADPLATPIVFSQEIKKYCEKKMHQLNLKPIIINYSFLVYLQMLSSNLVFI